MYMAEEGRDPLSSAAEVARFVVHLEMAYDVVDEMASNPRRYAESLYKLSRLVAKVLNDLEKVEPTREEDKEVVEYARRALASWALREKQLLEYLENLNDKDRDVSVKKFAALAIAPDKYTLRLKELLESGGRAGL